MSTKTKKAIPASKNKKAAASAPAKKAVAAPLKKTASAKAAPLHAKAANSVKATVNSGKAKDIEIAAAPAIDLEETEEQEEAAAAASAQSSGSAAALAAVTGSSTEMSASFKNFRHHPDMENFYRFIFDNDLRHEALAIIDDIMKEKQLKKQLKVAKLGSH